MLSKGDLTGTIDVDDLKENGIYAINEQSANLSNCPITYGVFIVFNPKGAAGGGHPILQMAVAFSGETFVRLTWVNVWRSWVKLSPTT